MTVKTWLTDASGYGVPAEHVRILISSHKGASPPSSSKLPTKEYFTEAVGQVAQDAISAGPGDSLIIIIYSGHGGRDHTIYPNRKGNGTYDEYLCTLGEDFRDLEFADLLNELTNKGLTVLVLLDSCHSGGADRDAPPPGRGEWQIKCQQSEGGQPDWATPAAPGELESGGGHRNAALVPSWFSTSRNHTLVAACQPTEYSQEGTFDGKRGGWFTHYLIKALHNLRPSKEPVSYGILVEHIRTLGLKHQLNPQKEPQHPMLLGDPKRVIFGKQDVQSAMEVGGLRAGVTEVGDKTIKLDKGGAQGVSEGDIFFCFLRTRLRSEHSEPRHGPPPAPRSRGLRASKLRHLFLG